MIKQNIMAKMAKLKLCPNELKFHLFYSRKGLAIKTHCGSICSSST